MILARHMGKEHETQVLGIDIASITKKLRKLGAKEEGEFLQKRYVFDIRCLGLRETGTGEWIRLREAKGKATITYKNKQGTGISETEETEITVDNFDKAAEILSKLKCFTGKYYQENKRKRFTLKGIEFTIDTWPKIPAFLEIEAGSKEKVKEGLRLLGLEGKDSGHLGLLEIYEKYGINLHEYKEIKFG